MMGTFNKGRMVTIFLVILSAIALLVSTGTDYWSQSKLDRAVHMGLWKGCTKIGKNIHCFQTPDKFTPEWKRATRAMMVIADVMYFFILAYLILMHIKHLPGYPIGILLILIFWFSVIGLSVYTDKSGIRRVSGLEFGFSFICGWCGSVMSLLAAVMALVDSLFVDGSQPRYSQNTGILRA